MLDGFETGLRQLWRAAPKAAIDAILQTVDDVFHEFEIDTALEAAHFMAQISHECGGGTITRENMNYRAERIMQIFGVGVHSARVTEAEAQRLAGHAKELAERVYGLGCPKMAKTLGNTIAGDGYRYRGNGMLQLTGRGSHKHVGEMVGADLEENPEQLQDPAISFRVAAAEFKALNCLPAAAADNVTLVTKRVNGGKNGLAERAVWLRKWKRYLADVEEPAKAPRGGTAPTEPVKPLMSSKIAQGTVAGTGLTVVGAVSQVASVMQQTTDSVSTAKDAADNALTVVATVKPFLGLMPSVWIAVAVGCAASAIVMGGFTLWQRYKKLRDQGV